MVKFLKQVTRYVQRFGFCIVDISLKGVSYNSSSIRTIIPSNQYLSKSIFIEARSRFDSLVSLCTRRVVFAFRCSCKKSYKNDSLNKNNFYRFLFTDTALCRNSARTNHGTERPDSRALSIERR